MFKESTKKFFETKKVKHDKKTNMFRFELQSKDVHLKLKDDIKFCFLSRKKACIMRVVFNTFCFVQENSYAFAETSCQGHKELLPDGQIVWSLKKKEIDLAFKNKNIHEDLTIKFYFRNTSDQTEQEKVKNEIQETICNKLYSKSANSASNDSARTSQLSDDKANKSEDELQAELNAEKKLTKSSTTSGGHESDNEDSQQSDEHVTQVKEKQKKNFLLKKMKKVLLFSKKTNDSGENGRATANLNGKSTSESD